MTRVPHPEGPMAQLIDGKKIAAELRCEIAGEVEKLRRRGIEPGLAFVLIEGNPISPLYVTNKKKACEEVGIRSFVHKLGVDLKEQELLQWIEKWNRDSAVHGILVQLPLPLSIDAQKIMAAIDPKKDVDGFHPLNVGRLYLGLPGLRPCTPLGVLALLEAIGFDLKGKEATVVGRSIIVGRPLAFMLSEKNATVTLCHRATQNLPEKIGRAELLVVATGKPGLVKGEWIRKGSVVIDVGISRGPDGKITGDVAFEEAVKRASFITPVPGGVGPMTIAMLLKNTLTACKAQVC